MPDKIIDVNSFDQYYSDTQKYAVYISRSRVTSDYRDGQKPVQRKILYAMYEQGAINTLMKSSAIVGEVMKNYHPHGDVGIYNTMKPMANWFEINMPLLYTESNFGNFQGDGQAAPRYTDIKLSQFAMDCMIGELKETNEVVDWVKNYNETKMEPEYLPAKVPVLLINGTFGIGSGVKVEIPRHNINEVIDATISLIKDPESKVVLIPDHCMPCEIMDTNWKEISNKGNGTYKVRGIINTIEYKGYPTLQITSLPDLVFLDSIRDKITKLIDSNVLIQIKEEEDLSTPDQLDYRIILKRGSDPEYVKQVIYSQTDMEKNCRINFEVLDGINLIRMSYKSYLQAFIAFRKLTKFRLYCNRLQPTQTRIHQLETYIKVLSSGYIDEIIDNIRKHKGNDNNYLIEFICKKVKITPLQAKFIISRQLSQLSMGALNNYKEEYKKLMKSREDFIAKIKEEDFANEIIQELEEFKNKYGNKPRRKIISSHEANGIPQGIFKIVLTQKNMIKKLQENDHINIRGNDSPKYVIKGDNIENILLFDEQGKVFKLPINKIPFTDKNSNGIDVRMLSKNMTSNINTVLYEPVVKSFANKTLKYYIVVVTKNGNIKKMDLDDILTATPSGIFYIKLDNGDVVKDVLIISSISDLIVYSNTKAIRLNINDIPHLKRSTKGSRAIDAPTVDGLSLITKDTTDVVVITENGRVNRFNIVALPVLSRGKKGSNVIKLGAGDKIKAIYGLNSKDSIVLTTQTDRITLNVSELQEGSSISPGVKVLNTRTNKILRCDIIKNK